MTSKVTCDKVRSSLLFFRLIRSLEPGVLLTLKFEIECLQFLKGKNAKIKDARIDIYNASIPLERTTDRCFLFLISTLA